MAFIGAITAGVAGPGDALKLADALFQKQVSIVEPISGDTVYINVSESVDLNMSVAITEKPITDQGSAVDYISRNSEPMTLTGFISNRNVDLRRDPAGVFAAYAAAFAPGVAAAASSGLSAISNFVDLGADEIDKKISTLRKWMLAGMFVDVLGSRIDPKKFTKEGQAYRFLIEAVHEVSNGETGDGAGIQINFKHITVIGATRGGKQGSFLKETVFGVVKSTFVTPFR